LRAKRECRDRRDRVTGALPRLEGELLPHDAGSGASAGFNDGLCQMPGGDACSATSLREDLKKTATTDRGCGPPGNRMSCCETPLFKRAIWRTACPGPCRPDRTSARARISAYQGPDCRNQLYVHLAVRPGLRPWDGENTLYRMPS